MQVDIDLALEIYQLKQEVTEMRKLLSWAVENEQKLINLKQKNQSILLQIKKAEDEWKLLQGC